MICNKSHFNSSFQASQTIYAKCQLFTNNLGSSTCRIKCAHCGLCLDKNEWESFRNILPALRSTLIFILLNIIWRAWVHQNWHFIVNQVKLLLKIAGQHPVSDTFCTPPVNDFTKTQRSQKCLKYWVLQSHISPKWIRSCLLVEIGLC